MKHQQTQKKLTWKFSLLLLVAYLATFHLWLHLDRGWIVGSGIGISILLSGALVRFNNARYFVNNYDLFWHGIVIVDILLESILIAEHNHYYFYLCAIAFAFVVGGYRYHAFKKHKRI